MSPDNPNPSITLYFRAGSSDKVYQAGIEPKGDGFVVNFAYGRRGSTLQTGTKTAKPVPMDVAVKVYDKLVAEKMAKGYTPGEDGTPYQATDREALATGIFPQLLNSIDEDQAERLICDDDWLMQEKFDGKRIMNRRQGGQVTGINRKGLTVALPQPIAEHTLELAGQWLMDGEAMGDVYVAFDLLELANADLRQAPYSDRLGSLSHMPILMGKGSIRLVKTAFTTAQKREMLAQLRRENREGAVFKRASAPYTPGRPASGGDQLKLKFTATASCIVTGVSKGKRSVELAVLDKDANQVVIGKVTIPPNQPIPKAGSVVEVRYLYAYPGGSLFQPFCLGVRDDIEPAACTLDQLKYKAAGEDEGPDEVTGEDGP